VSKVKLRHKLFYSSLALLLIISLLFTLVTSREYYTLNETPKLPYAYVSKIIANSSGFYFFISINNQGYNFIPRSGYISVPDLGESGNITTVVNSTLVVVKLNLKPLLYPNQSVLVKGLIEGDINGAPTYISFFSFGNIFVENSIKIVKVYYSTVNNSALLIVTLNVSSIIPLEIIHAVNMSLISHTNHRYVFNTQNVFFFNNSYIPPGNNLVNLTAKLTPFISGNKFVLIYQKKISHTDTYLLYLPLYVKYLYPNENITRLEVLYYNGEVYEV